MKANDIALNILKSSAGKQGSVAPTSAGTLSADKIAQDILKGDNDTYVKSISGSYDKNIDSLYADLNDVFSAINNGTYYSPNALKTLSNRLDGAISDTKRVSAYLTDKGVSNIDNFTMLHNELVSARQYMDSVSSYYSNFADENDYKAQRESYDKYVVNWDTSGTSEERNKALVSSGLIGEAISSGTMTATDAAAAIRKYAYKNDNPQIGVIETPKENGNILSKSWENVLGFFGVDFSQLNLSPEGFVAITQLLTARGLDMEALTPNIHSGYTWSSVLGTSISNAKDSLIPIVGPFVNVYNNIKDIAEGFSTDTSANDTIKKVLYELGFSKEEATQYLGIIAYENEHNESNWFSKMLSGIEGKNAFEKVIGSGISIGASVLGGIPAFLDQSIQNIEKAFDPEKIVSYNTDAQAMSNWSNEFRASVAGDLGKVGGFVYQTGMSILDSALAMLITAGIGSAMGAASSAGAAGSAAASAKLGTAQKFAQAASKAPWVSGVLLGSSAGASTTASFKAMGYSDEEAMKMGVAAAFLEGFFEKASIEYFLGPTAQRLSASALYSSSWGTKILKTAGAIGIQSLCEGTEEGLTDLGNLAAELLILGNRSPFMESVRERMQSGNIFYHDAVKEETLSRLSDAFVSFLGGALSGGVFGMSGAASLNAFYQKEHKRRISKIASKLDGTYVVKTAEALTRIPSASDALAQSHTSAITSAYAAINSASGATLTSVGADAALMTEMAKVAAEYDTTLMTFTVMSRATEENARRISDLLGIKITKDDLASNKGGIATIYASYLFCTGYGERNFEKQAEKAKMKMAEYIKAEAEKGTDTAGNVYFDEDLSERKLSRIQSVSIEAAESVAKVLGVNVFVYDSKTTTDVEGKKSNGYYSKSKKTIYLDVSAGIDEDGTMLFTLSHELVHFVKNTSLEKYEALRDFLFSSFSEEFIESRKQEKINLAKQHGDTLSPEAAEEEVVADFCQRLLTEKGGMKKINALARKNEGLAEAIKAFFSSASGRIGRAYRGKMTDAVEGEIARTLGKRIKKLTALFEDAILTAGVANREGKSEGTREANDTEDAVVHHYKSDGSKITVEMTDAERYQILKNRDITISGKTDITTLESVMKKLDITESDLDLSKYGDKKRLFKKLGEEFGVFKQYNNPDTRVTFSFSRGGISESVSKQHKEYILLAKLLTCIDHVIENAVGIEVHNRNGEGYKADATLKNVYVLASAFIDGENIIPVKLEIKEFFDKENTLYVAIALESIKKNEIVKQEDATNGVAQQYSPSFTVSIADFMSKINPSDKSFLKYIPDGFLDSEQKRAKQEALVGNTDTTDPDIVHKYKRTFSYSELIAKGSLQGFIIDYSQQVPLTADGSIDAPKIVKTVKGKCKSIQTNGGTKYYTYATDLRENVEILGESITHGFIRRKTKNGKKVPNRSMINARISLKIPEILATSIEVNRSKRGNNPDILYTHVMLGTVALELSNGTLEYYAVRSMIEERVNRDHVLVEAEILGKLYAVNAKKIGSPRARGAGNGVALAHSRTYAYSISDFLQDVKSEFDNTFSLDVYQHLGVQRKHDDFSTNLLHQYKPTSPAEAKVRELAKEYYKTYSGSLKKGEFIDGFADVAKDLIRSLDLDDTDALNSAANRVNILAKELAKNPLFPESSEYTELSEIKRAIRELRIKIPGEDRKAGFDSVGGFEKFRRAHIGHFTLSKNGTDMDTLYTELHSLFGETWFPSNLTTVQDQLLHLGEIATKKAELQDGYDVDAATSYYADKLTQEISKLVTKYSPLTKPYEIVTKTRLEFRALNILNRMYEYTVKKRRPVSMAVNGEVEALVKEIAKLRKGEGFALTVGNIGAMGISVKNFVEMQVPDSKDDIGGFYISDEEKDSLKVISELSSAKERSEEPLTATELHHFISVLRIVQRLTRAFGMEFDIESGKWRDNSENVRAVIDNSMAMYGAKKSKMHRKLIDSKQLRSLIPFLTPTDYIRLAFGSDSDNLVNRYVRDIVNGADKARARAAELIAPFEEYAINHSGELKSKSGKRFMKHLFEDTIEFRGIKLSIGEFMSLYCTAKREQAKLGLVSSKICFGDNTSTKEKAPVERVRRELELISGVSSTAVKKKAIDKAWRDFKSDVDDAFSSLSKEDRDFVMLVEHFFGTVASEEKRRMDLLYYGYTNVGEGYYFPIQRHKGVIASDVSETFSGFLGTVDQSFNKAIVKNANTSLFITNIFSVVERHAKGLATYRYTMAPIQNFSKLISKNLGSNTGVKSVQDMLDNKAGKSSLAYIKEWLRNIQGVYSSRPSAVLSDARRLVAVNALSFNLQTIFKQAGSLYAMGAESGVVTDPKAKPRRNGRDRRISMSRYTSAALIRSYLGFAVDKASRGKAGAGIRNADLMAKYSSAAAYRMRENTAFAAALGETSNATLMPAYKSAIEAVGNVGMKGMKATDLRVCLAMWDACQAFVRKTEGYEIGSKENLEASGKLLDDMINRYQDTSSVALKPLASRGDSGLSMFTMFASQSLKLFSSLYTASVEHSIKGTKESGRGVRSAAAAVLGNAVWSSVVITLMNLLKKKGQPEDEKDRPLWSSFALSLACEITGIVPVIGESIEVIIELFMGGEAYDVGGDPLSDVANSFVDIVKEIYGGIFAGKDVSPKRTLDAIGVLVGLPTRNVYTYLSSLMALINKRLVYTVDYYYGNLEPDMKELEAAIKQDNDLADTIFRVMFSERVNKKGETNLIKDTAVSELIRLRKAGESFTLLPSSAPKEYTKKQVKAYVKTVEDSAHGVNALVSTDAYQSLTDSEKASAISAVWSIYKDAATCYAEKNEEDTSASKAVRAALILASDRPETLASIYSAVKGYMSTEGRKTADRNVYLARLARQNKLNRDEIALLAYALGDTTKDTVSVVLRYARSVDKNKIGVSLYDLILTKHRK